MPHPYLSLVVDLQCLESRKKLRVGKLIEEPTHRRPMRYPDSLDERSLPMLDGGLSEPNGRLPRPTLGANSPSVSQVSGDTPRTSIHKNDGVPTQSN